MENLIYQRTLMLSHEFELLLKDTRLCELNDINYAGGHIPDYSNPKIQLFYLLKYAPAYLVEYYSIYKEILKLTKKEEIYYKILSIGAGASLDYLGMQQACQDEGINFLSLVDYHGIDKIGWTPFAEIKNPNYHFSYADIYRWNKLDAEDYNVIIFPKSIFELSHFNKIIALFHNSQFQSDKLILVNSLKTGNTEDKDKFNKLVSEIMMRHNYWMRGDSVGIANYYTPKANRLTDLYPGFEYPPKTMNMLMNLYIYCSEFRKNGKSCDNHCVAHLDRYPIMNAAHINYQIIILVR